MTDEQIIERCTAAGIKWIPPELPDDCDYEMGFPGSFDMVSMSEMRALLSASKPAVAPVDEHADLAFSVYSGLNALRWLLNITTEFDRKDVRTRQAARLLDEYTDSFGKTNRDRLEDMWKTLNDKLPNDGRINEYLRAHDAASREIKTNGAIND